MKSASRTKNTFRNSFWGILSKILGMVCPFFFRAIIIRQLGAEYIGLNGLFKSILTVLNMTELGFGSAIIYMMYKPIVDHNLAEIRALFNSIRKIYRIVCGIILVLGCCVYPFLNVLVKNDTGADVNIYLLYSMYLFHSAASYFSSAYRSTLFTAHQRNDVISKIVLITEVIRYSLQAVVLFTIKNYYVYLLVMALSVIPQNVLYYVFSRKMYPDIYCEGEISKQQKEEIKAKVIPLLGHRIGGTVIVSIDDLVISAFLGISFLTQYDNYYYIFHSISTFLVVLRSSVIASLGNKIYSSSNQELYATYKKIHFIWIMIVGWCTCFLAGLYQPFIQMWVGAQYVYDDSIMLWICAYFFVWQFRNIAVTMKEAAGLWEPDRWKPIIGMVLNLGFSILMVKLTGSVLGVLVPTMVIMLLVYFPWETYVLFKHVFKRSCKEYLLLTAKYCASAVASIALVYFSTRSIPFDGLGYFALRFVLCVIIPAAIITVSFFRTEEFRNALSYVNIAVSKITKKVYRTQISTKGELNGMEPKWQNSVEGLNQQRETSAAVVGPEQHASGKLTASGRGEALFVGDTFGIKVDIRKSSGDQCTGCGACFAVCPVHAISMIAAEDGFVYPNVDQEKCIGCGKCMRVCHALDHDGMLREPLACFAAQKPAPDVLRKSTSGGLFYALAEAVFREGGVVYGCVYDGDYSAFIARADSPDALEPMHGSKYVWSDPSKSYENVKKDLEAGKRVLYSGLPCQAAGLKKYLSKDYENLYTVDVLCGGSPSPYAFQRYLETITDEAGKKGLRFQFRDKEKYGSGVCCTYIVNGKKHYEDYVENSFYFAFCSKSRLTWRKSCYQCGYKSIRRVSDITIGDYWGVENHHSSFDPREGVSAVLLNTEHGKDLFDQIKASLHCEESQVSFVTEKNSLVSSISEGHVPVPENRDAFFSTIKEKGWRAADKAFLHRRKVIIRKRFLAKVRRKIVSVISGKKKN